MTSYSQNRPSYPLPFSSEYYHAHGYQSPTFFTNDDSALPHSNNPANCVPSAQSTFGSLDEVYLTAQIIPEYDPISVPHSQQQHRHNVNGGCHQSNSQQIITSQSQQQHRHNCNGDRHQSNSQQAITSQSQQQHRHNCNDNRHQSTSQQAITLNHSPQPRYVSNMDSKNFPVVSSRHGSGMIPRHCHNESWPENDPEGDEIGTPDLIRTPSTSTIDSNSPTYNITATIDRHRNRQNSNDTSSQASGSPQNAKRVPCPNPSCWDPDKGMQRSYSRKADLSRHIKSTHEPVHIDCPWPRCDRVGQNGFTRKDHLVEHQRGYHNDPIPKRGEGGQMRESAVSNGRHEKRESTVRNGRHEMEFY